MIGTSQPLIDRLREHVTMLAENIGERNVFRPQALRAAESYIKQVWQDQGYQIATQSYRVRGVDCANLEITLPGVESPQEIILLGAHYDSVLGAPGANDNASGVAALLELSRLFATNPLRRTLRFVAFVNEEPPFFDTRDQGSHRYVAMARERSDDIRLMICLETIGYYRTEPASQRYPPLFRYFYPDRGNFVAFVSNFPSRKRMRELVNAFRKTTDFPVQHLATFARVPGVAWSDHLAFWQQGYQAVMVTDTAFYRYPYYHTSEDTPEKLDYASLTTVTSGLYKAISLIN